MEKRILILGGGQAQIELIKTAKSIGLYVIVVGIEGNYPGYKIADKVYYADIFDKSAVLEIAQKEHINGVSMVCSDFGLETMGYINDQLGLTGLSENVAIDSANKFQMKKILRDHGIKTADYRVISNDEEALTATRELHFPLIVKAVDLQGSRGIYICKNEQEVLENYRKSIYESRQDYCIVEEFIEGEEFGAQAFVYNNEVLFVQPHGDLIWNSGKTNIPIGHYMPLREDDDNINKETVKLITDSIIALGFNNCAVNVDLIIKDNIPYIIELTGRVGANSLPELTSYYMGLNYYEMVIRCAIGESAKDYFAMRSGGADCVLTRQLFTIKQGVIGEIKVENDSYVKQLELFVKEGDMVSAFTNSKDCIGKALCIGKNLRECNLAMDNFVRNKLHIEII